MAVPCPADTPSNLDKARSTGGARLNIKLSAGEKVPLLIAAEARLADRVAVLVG